MDIVDAELIWPGTFIDHDDAEASHQAEGLLLTLDNSFVEALLALLCFEEARSARSADLDDWERRSRERTECEGQAWGDRVPPESESSWEAMMAALDERRLAGERLLMRRMLERGELPQSISHHLPFMYARSFVFALDTIDKVLEVLEVHPGADRRKTGARRSRGSPPRSARRARHRPSSRGSSEGPRPSRPTTRSATGGRPGLHQLAERGDHSEQPQWHQLWVHLEQRSLRRNRRDVGVAYRRTRRDPTGARQHQVARPRNLMWAISECRDR